MDESTSREKILKKVRGALLEKEDSQGYDIDKHTQVMRPFNDEADIQFAREFTRINGNFIYCANQSELQQNLITLVKSQQMDGIFTNETSIREVFDASAIPCMLNPADIRNLKTSVTFCEFLIARFGAIMVSSSQMNGRKIFSYPENHIVIAFKDQMVDELEDAVRLVQKKYEQGLPSQISIISGPSRTADIEKTLVLGAHGPKNLYVLFVDEA